MSEEKSIKDEVDYKLVNVAVETREQIVDKEGEAVSERELLIENNKYLKQILKVIK